MSEEKWYQSVFGKSIGYAALCAGIGIGGIGAGELLKGCDTQYYKHLTDEARIKAETDTRNEFQRLKTIEEIVRTQGAKMSLQELQLFLKENNLQERK